MLLLCVKDVRRGTIGAARRNPALANVPKSVGAPAGMASSVRRPAMAKLQRRVLITSHQAFGDECEPLHTSSETE